MVSSTEQTCDTCTPCTLGPLRWLDYLLTREVEEWWAGRNPHRSKSRRPSLAIGDFHQHHHTSKGEPVHNFWYESLTGLPPLTDHSWTSWTSQSAEHSCALAAAGCRRWGSQGLHSWQWTFRQSDSSRTMYSRRRWSYHFQSVIELNASNQCRGTFNLIF